MRGILDEAPSPLEDDAAVSVDVLLARPHSPGNLGSAARACKAFGARLLLLDPRADAAHEDARAFASGAEDILDAAPRLSSWDEAEEGASALLALSSLRGRSTRGLPPAWSWAAARRAAREGRLVLAFGPERSGLTTEEMRRAAGRLAIPTRPGFPVLNLAQAVAAALALLATGAPARLDGRGGDGAGTVEARRGSSDGSRAGVPALRRLREELEAALRASGFFGRDDDAVLLELLSPLLRAGTTPREAELWTGALRKLGHRVGTREELS
jgi:tRNA/rRNA methyltransferase